MSLAPDALSELPTIATVVVVVVDDAIVVNGTVEQLAGTRPSIAQGINCKFTDQL